MLRDIPANLLYQPGDLPSLDVLEQLQKMQPIKLNEWQRARLGKITASKFGIVKRNARNGEWSETALSYLYDLLGEHLTGEPSQTFTGSDATEWGNLYEREAIEAYTKRTGRKVQAGHFVQHSQLALVGGTPDGFVGEKGIIEVKCPFTFKNHVRTVITRTVPDEYLDQCLGLMGLTGRQWCDFVSYDPRIPAKHRHARLAIVRIYRRDFNALKTIDLLGRIADFHDLLLEKLTALKIQL